MCVSAFALHIIGLGCCALCVCQEHATAGTRRSACSSFTLMSWKSWRPWRSWRPRGPIKTSLSLASLHTCVLDTTTVKKQLGVTWNEARWSKKSTGVGLMYQPPTRCTSLIGLFELHYLSPSQDCTWCFHPPQHCIHT